MEPRQWSSRTRPIGNASEQQNLRYTAHFGLRAQPFTLTADPRFFYATPEHEEAYTTLLYGLHARKGCLTLIGEAGTGKTTVIHRVREHLRWPIATAVFDTPPTLRFEDLLDFLCRTFALPVKGGRRLEKLQGLHEFLVLRLREGGTGIFIIDEAQNLSEEILEHLRLLSNFELVGEKLLQILLVGQPELEEKLERPELRQLKQRIALRARLTHLKAQEVAPFIHYRLHLAGCARQDVFTPEALQRIAMYSGGIPRLINTLCDNALLTASRAGQHTISASMIGDVARKFRLQPTVGWQPELGSEVNANGTGSHVMAPPLPNGSASTPQVFIAGPGRSWLKRLTWSGALLLLLALLCIGSFSLAPQQNGERATPLRMGFSAEQNTDEPQEQQRGSSLQETPSLSPAEQQRTSLIEEPPRVVSPSPLVKVQAPEQQGQSVTIARGDTLAELVLKMYGAEHVLALDLLKEYNPHLADLNRIAPGEQIWLPFLTQDTLVRPQADGSYHLILGTFPSLREAQKRVWRARRRGYAATITPRQISGTWWVQRVEVEQLPDLAAVDRARSVMVKSKG